MLSSFPDEVIHNILMKIDWFILIQILDINKQIYGLIKTYYVNHNISKIIKQRSINYLHIKYNNTLLLYDKYTKTELYYLEKIVKLFINYPNLPFSINNMNRCNI